MQITDIHNDNFPFVGLLNMGLLNYLYHIAHPDLTIATGDIVSANNVTHKYEKLWKKFVLPMHLQQQEYAITLGNHDTQNNLNRSGIMNLDMSSAFSHSDQALSLTSPGSNYYIPIYSSYNESHVAAVLWIFDTHSSGCLNFTSGAGCIEPVQISWYKEQYENLTKFYGNQLIHIAFFHIPLQEYMTMYNTKPIYGKRNENVCCQSINTHAFKSFSERRMRAVFVGHDHNNDYGGYLDNVELVYGRKTGFGYYGPVGNVERGARVIELKEVYIQNSETRQNEIFVFLDHKIITSSGEYILNGEAYLRDDYMVKCT